MLHHNCATTPYTRIEYNHEDEHVKLTANVFTS